MELNLNQPAPPPQLPAIRIAVRPDGKTDIELFGCDKIRAINILLDVVRAIVSTDPKAQPPAPRLLIPNGQGHIPDLRKLPGE